MDEATKQEKLRELEEQIKPHSENRCQCHEEKICLCFREMATSFDAEGWHCGPEFELQCRIDDLKFSRGKNANQEGE